MINGSNSYFICNQKDMSNQMSLPQVIFLLINILSKFSSEQWGFLCVLFLNYICHVKVKELWVNKHAVDIRQSN